jgi:outer membrane protein assembly factor BamA
LSLDEEEKDLYDKLKWDILVPEIAVGVADDGTVLSNASILFSDLLGDHRVQANFYSVSSYSNVDIQYLNLKHRFNYGFRVFDFRDFFYLSDQFGTNREEQYRISGAMGMIQWPFNKYYRVEGSLGYLYRSQTYPYRDFLTGAIFLQEFSENYPFATFSFNGDTTRYKSFGPYHGKRFGLSVMWAPSVGDGRSFTEYMLDYRGYARMTSRSLFAWRLAGIISDGDGANVYSLGGLNQLRGYDFREFFGTRVAYSNFEFRFPLVDELRFPIGSIREIRGVFFFDVGSAWFEDGYIYDQNTFSFRKWDFYDSDTNRLRDGYASYGVGFNFFFFGPLQLHWSFARRTDLKDSDSDFRTDFYIAYDF